MPKGSAPETVTETKIDGCSGPLQKITKYLHISMHTSLIHFKSTIYYLCCAMLCRFSHFRLVLTPRTVARQALLSKGSPGKKTAVDCHFLLQYITYNT